MLGSFYLVLHISLKKSSFIIAIHFQYGTDLEGLGSSWAWQCLLTFPTLGKVKFRRIKSSRPDPAV